MAGNKIIQDLLLNISSNTAELSRGLQSAQNQLSTFGNSIKSIGSTLGIAFAGKEVLSFGLEVSKLAAKAEGVKNAFDKLPNSTRLMSDLKNATKGTVSELELMQKAVNFKNFNLPLEQMPKLLKFASVTAQQTGQDVNYLVDSIVTGLGRKSLPILDNLGLGSAEINEQLKQTPNFVEAVGAIVEKRLGAMGDIVETNITKTQRLSASWENFKVAIGGAANETGFLGGAIDALTGALDVAASSNLSFFEKVAAFAGGPMALLSAKMKDTTTESKKASDEIKKQEQVIKEVDRGYKEFGNNIDAYLSAVKSHIYYEEIKAEVIRRQKGEIDKQAAAIENITNLQAKQTELQALQLTQTGSQLAQTNIELKQIDEKIKKLKELGLAEMQLHNISKIPKSIEDYTKQIGSANSGSVLKKKEPSFGEGVGKIDVAGVTANAFEGINEKILEHQKLVQQTGTMYTDMGSTVETALGEWATSGVESLGTAFISMADGAKSSFSEMILGLLKSLRNLLIGLFAKALAGVISGAATSGGPPPVALALAAIGVAGITAMWAKIPKFEKGGYFSGGGMGGFLAGEKGPEWVQTSQPARIYKHSDTMKMFSGGGAGNMQLQAVVTGDQLKFVLQEAERRR